MAVFFRHLEDFQNIPEIFKDEVFIKAFEKAELAKYSDEELQDYEGCTTTCRSCCIS
jgi:hypothetical protein